MYPSRLDILQVPKQGILMKDNLCTATARAYIPRAEENDRINKKHASCFLSQTDKAIVAITNLHASRPWKVVGAAPPPPPPGGGGSAKLEGGPK
jgi:hypothetical protein